MLRKGDLIIGEFTGVDGLVHDELLERVDSLEEKLIGLKGWLTVVATLLLMVVVYLVLLRMRIL